MLGDISGFEITFLQLQVEKRDDYSQIICRKIANQKRSWSAAIPQGLFLEKMKLWLAANVLRVTVSAACPVNSGATEQCRSL